MPSETGDSSEKSTSAMKTSASRAEQLQQSLMIWRHILLPLNHLLEWEHKYDPLVIGGIITLIFTFLYQMDPPIVTLISCLTLILVLMELLGPVAIQLVFKDAHWTPVKEARYIRLCRRVANLEQHVKEHCDSILKTRKERPLLYLMAGGITLAFIAFCGQHVDNLLLSYVITLTVCLTPGIRNRRIIAWIQQSVLDFWTSNAQRTEGGTSSTSDAMNKTKAQ